MHKKIKKPFCSCLYRIRTLPQPSQIFFFLAGDHSITRPPPYPGRNGSRASRLAKGADHDGDFFLLLIEADAPPDPQGGGEAERGRGGVAQGVAREGEDGQQPRHVAHVGVAGGQDAVDQFLSKNKTCLQLVALLGRTSIKIAFFLPTKHF